MHFSRPILLLVVSMGLFFSPVHGQGTDGWLLKNDKDNVKVYYKKTADIQEIKLATSLQTTLTGLVHLLSEVENYPTWGYKVMESRLLKRISDTEMFYYTRLDFPWPLADRDMIMHTTLKQDPVSHRIISTSTAMPDYLDKVPDVVRITNARTQWTLVPGKNGWVYVEYYLHSNPGGNIPDWVVNMAIDVGPRETIKGMRGLLPQTRYQAVNLNYIKN
ncbi:MAG: START domain-containing protein [Saprospiraceae bacterium]